MRGARPDRLRLRTRSPCTSGRQCLDVRAAPPRKPRWSCPAPSFVVASATRREQCEHGDDRARTLNQPRFLEINCFSSSVWWLPDEFCTRLRSPCSGRMGKYPGNGRRIQLCAAALRSLGEPRVPRTAPSYVGSSRAPAAPGLPAGQAGLRLRIASAAEARVPSRRKPKWRNWQTRRTQNPVPFGEWGFDSPLRHYSTTGLAGRPGFSGANRYFRKRRQSDTTSFPPRALGGLPDPPSFRGTSRLKRGRMRKSPASDASTNERRTQDHPNGSHEPSLAWLPSVTLR